MDEFNQYVTHFDETAGRFDEKMGHLDEKVIGLKQNVAEVSETQAPSVTDATSLKHSKTCQSLFAYASLASGVSYNAC